jgi:hypothetical protein
VEINRFEGGERKACVAYTLYQRFAREHDYYFKPSVREAVIPVMVVGVFHKHVLVALFRCLAQQFIFLSE